MTSIRALYFSILVTFMAPGVFAQGPQEPRTSAPVVSETLAVQVMLDRLGFSSGEIDGRAGSNVRRAITAFQGAQQMVTSGEVDEETWKRLAELSAPAQPLTTYQITPADLAGPFVTDIPADLIAQSNLRHLGYTSPLEAIAEKFHSSPALLKALNPHATFAIADERLTVPNVEPVDTAPLQQTRQQLSRRGTPRSGTTGATGTSAEPTAGRIVVRKATSSLTVEDQSGRVIFHAPVTVGSDHDPLPIGTWQVTTVQHRPAFNYNPALFWDANPAHSKARIPAGPNNPVGVVWIDLTKEHYGIHGTPEPSRVGHSQSHGCIRLTNWDALRLARLTTKGTTVVFE